MYSFTLLSCRIAVKKENNDVSMIIKMNYEENWAYLVMKTELFSCFDETITQAQHRSQFVYVSV